MLLPGYAGASVLHEDVLGADFELNIEVSPSVTTQEMNLEMGSGPRPGHRPQVNVVGVDVPAALVFHSPFSVEGVRLHNPQESTAVVVYQLRMSVAELRRQTGLTGYDEEQYKELSARTGFDEGSHYIVLSQTRGILPGEWAEEMALGTLPNGATLPAGRYTAELIMVPFDQQTHQSMMISAVVLVPFVIESALMSVEVAGSHADMRLFNPVDAPNDLVYSIQLSQAEVRRVSGQPHQPEENLVMQAKTPGFDEEYEFISLYESEVVSPGAYVEGVRLHALPDGEQLPQGTYTAWLVRYALDAQTQQEMMLDVNTQLQLVVK